MSKLCAETSKTEEAMAFKTRDFLPKLLRISAATYETQDLLPMLPEP